MAIPAKIEAVLDNDMRHDEGLSTLVVELDSIPGAVWQMELQDLMPPDMRVSLFERGGQKCALLTFPPGRMQQAYDAFQKAVQGANEVSAHAHLSATKAAGS